MDNDSPYNGDYNWNHRAGPSATHEKQFLSDGIVSTRVSNSKDYWWEFKKSRQNYQRDLLVHFKDNRAGAWVLVGRESQSDRRDDTAQIDTFYTEEDALKCIKHIMAGNSAASYCKQPKPLSQDELAELAEAETYKKDLKEASDNRLKQKRTKKVVEAPKQQDVSVSIGKNFVIMGSDRIVVSPDGKKITTFTKNDVKLTRVAVSDQAAAIGTSISDDFNTVVLNGVTIKRIADGNLVLTAPKGTTLSKQHVPEIGEPLADGWIYLGNSPETGEDYSMEPEKGSIKPSTWYKARDHAHLLAMQGNKHARVPTATEWKDIFNKIVKGGNNYDAKLVTSRSYYDPTHWTSSRHETESDMLVQDLSNGRQHHCASLENKLWVRVVRTEPYLGG